MKAYTVTKAMEKNMTTEERMFYRKVLNRLWHIVLCLIFMSVMMVKEWGFS